MTNHLIGREEQSRQLNTSLNQTMGGRMQIVFVTGEAGIGKTTLVTAFLDAAKKKPDLLIARSKCYAVAGSQHEPYLPFLQILEAVIAEKPDDAIWNRLRRGMAEIAPDWLAVIPGVGNIIAAAVRTYQWGQREFGQQPGTVDTSRRMVQYANALRLVAETIPLVIWIDDLHWADSATLDLLSFLADQASDTRILLVGAYRPTDVAIQEQGKPHPLRSLVSKLERYHQCTKIELPAFSAEDLVKFLTRGGHNLPSSFVNLLWRQSGGNPLFVQEYVALMHMRGLLKRDRGIFVLAQPDVEVEIPGTVQAVIEQRLALISQDLQHLLSYASVQGERFASRVLAQLLTTPELDVLEKLNLLDRVHNLIRELEAQHLIVKVGAEYQFIHALIQQVLYNNLSAGQRCQLHSAIAQLLENLYGESAEQYAADLAIHFHRGGIYERAIHYYLQASHNALGVSAFDDAIGHAETALQIIRNESKDEHTIRWRIEALMNIAEAQYWKANYDAALMVCQEGEKLCQLSKYPEEQARFLYTRGLTYFSLGRRNEQLATIRQAIEILGPEPVDHNLQGYLHIALHNENSIEPTWEIEQH
jgi:predicted ATPase